MRHLPFPLLILALVFLLIAVRRVGDFSVPIWGAMLSGALAVVASGDLSIGKALGAIDGDVMLFLFAMFVIGDAMERSGLLFTLAYRLLSGAKTTAALVGRVLVGAGLTSALLMNDTLAVVGTPLVLLLAREHKLEPKLLLLTLAFAVTIGSVMSPIGNPQNLLIALHGGIEAPFRSFFGQLWLPTLLSLAVTFLVVRVMFRQEFHATPLRHTAIAVSDPALARLASISLGLLVTLVLSRALLASTHVPWELRLSHMGLAAALPILLFSPRRLAIVRHVDWQTLIFFAALFVLMQAVWDTGFFQGMAHSRINLASPGTVLGAGVLLSQLVSNVPLVALYLPLLNVSGTGEPALLALAAGSTIAGNLFLLGAASNVIIVQNAERRAGVTLGFFEFARVGVPLTIATAAIYWFFLPGQ